MVKITIIALIAMLVACTYQENRLLSSGGGKCTENHCYFCETKGDNSWCSRCGNGRAISAKDGTDRSCNKPLTVKNCRTAPNTDPSNADLCGECQRGYFLESPTSCVKVELKGCARPYKETANGPVLCNGCEGKFLLEDKTGCELKPKTELPDNCLYGGKASSGKCIVCDNNWTPSRTGMSCEEERIKGCAQYHPNDPLQCFLCNQEEGYYAFRSISVGGNSYQNCKFNAFLLGFNVVILSLLGLLLI
jgi:hypothetical protein